MATKVNSKSCKEWQHRSHDKSLPFYGPSLPRWVPNNRVDSNAMLTAFIAFKNTCDCDVYDYLKNFYRFEHKPKATVTVQVGKRENARTFVVNKKRRHT